MVTGGALLFAVGLIAINAAWPNAFAVVVAIGGVLGALMIFYEVRLTKRIAQAEFIRDLQTSFASDPNIGELWRKLLLHEPVVPQDRPLISSYLTFFETVYLLQARGALELSLADDLFRNRFFTAIGNKGVLEVALIREAGAFTNIHKLIVAWHAHLLAEAVPIHSGYYGYVAALLEAKSYEIVPLGDCDLYELEALQSRVMDSLSDHDWLRENTSEMLLSCLADHTTLGVRKDGELVAAAVLFDAGATEENLRSKLSTDRDEIDSSINLKLVLVSPEHRRFGVGRTLIELLEQRAAEMGKRELLCTIHPRNDPSTALFKSLGYERLGKVNVHYGRRAIFGRSLPIVERRWAR